jgi:hypothetical protein
MRRRRRKNAEAPEDDSAWMNHVGDLAFVDLGIARQPVAFKNRRRFTAGR